jgi:hypothetical protein
MKLFSLLVLSLLFVSCNTTEPLVQERMIINPTKLEFAPGEASKAVSITHTCTCPFSWTGTPSNNTPWLPAFDGKGDNSKYQLTIDTAKLPVGTSTGYYVVTSNGYGTDTLRITATK